ncbi:MAG: 4Fe-4S dicluster domain-containing protein [Enterobacteriaceae bacterium]
MNRFVMADPEWCIGCNTCLAACSQTHKAQGLQQHPRLAMTRTSKQTAPILCRHCDDAPCLRVCPVNAIAMQDKSVQINESLCIGCKLCALACPFGAITFAGSTPLNAPAQYQYDALPAQLSDLPSTPAAMDSLLSWDAGVHSVAVKCDLCAFSPDGPACIRVCPTDALHLVTAEVLEKKIQERRLRTALSIPSTLFDPTYPEQEAH